MDKHHHDPKDGAPLAAPERVYRVLREEILEGEIGPGERLASLVIAEQLGVSRTPVRAALVRLEAEGLVVREGGQSARVKQLTTDEIEEAYDVAMGLEGMLVYRLAQTATDEQLAELLDVANRMVSAAEAGDKPGWVDADQRFHGLLVELSDNSLAWAMMDRVETVVGRVRFLAIHANPRGAEQSAFDHRAVVEAVQRRDPEEARHLHQVHWERVRTANIQFLRETFRGGASFIKGPRRSASAKVRRQPTSS